MLHRILDRMLGNDSPAGPDDVAADRRPSDLVLSLPSTLRSSLLTSLPGVSSTDDVLGNSDDQLDSSSFIQAITVAKGMSHSAFAAAHLPVKATISHKSVPTATTPGNGQIGRAHV